MKNVPDCLFGGSQWTAYGNLHELLRLSPQTLIRLYMHDTLNPE